MNEKSLLDKLSQGKPRSNRVVYELLPSMIKNRHLFATVAQNCLNPDPTIQSRCIQILEKLSETNLDRVIPYKAMILEELTTSQLAEEAKWSLAKMIPRLELGQSEAEKAFNYCLQCFKDTSSRITMALMLDAIVSIAKYYPTQYAYQANQLLNQALHSPIPALSARARKLSKLRSSYVRVK